MSSPRDVILARLKRQHLISEQSHLNMLVDATENGTVRDAVSLRGFVKDRLCLDARPKWCKNTWTHLSSIQLNQCTALVDTGGSGVDDPHDQHIPPPPPTSMVEMTHAMKKLMYNGVDLPLVSSAPGQTSGLTKSHHRVEFDRNDWYLTNASEMERLTSQEERVLECSLCLVCLTSVSGRKYVTWCRRRDVADFRDLVNREKVTLNKYATSAIRAGDIFADMSYVDDNLGNLLERDVVDTLYFMEGLVGMMGARHPRGFNMPDVNHLLHRSVRLMGGSWELLDVYGRWKTTEDRLASHVKHLKRMVDDVVRSRGTFLKATTTDPEIVEAMEAKIRDKVKTLKHQLVVTRHHMGTTRTHRENLRKSLVEAIAETTLQCRPIPSEVTAIRDNLTSLPDSIGPVEDEAARVFAMNESRALRVLGLWDEQGEIPFHLITRENVKSAWHATQHRVHEDKTGRKTVGEDEKANTISMARDYLLGVCTDV